MSDKPPPSTIETMRKSNEKIRENAQIAYNQYLREIGQDKP